MDPGEINTAPRSALRVRRLASVPPPLQPCDSVYRRVGMRAGSQVHPAWAPSWAGPAWQSLCSWHGASLPRTVPGAWAGWRRKGEPPHCIPNNGRPGGAVLLPSPVPSPWGGEGPDRETEVVPMSERAKGKTRKGKPEEGGAVAAPEPRSAAPRDQGYPSTVSDCAGGALCCLGLRRRGPLPSEAGQEGPSTVSGCAGGSLHRLGLGRRGPSTFSGCAGGDLHRLVLCKQ